MNSVVEEALRQGRWGEIVTIEVGDQTGNDITQPDSATTTDEAKPPHSLTLSLTPCLDIRHGGFQWNPITPQREELSHFLRAKQWMFPMLNDHTRNRVYQEAIHRAISRIVTETHEAKEDKQGQPNQTMTILDIGCGTGLWGMVAARHLQALESQSNNTTNKELFRSFQVESIDMSRFMVQMAQQVVEDNHLSHCISVRETHSMQMMPHHHVQEQQKEEKDTKHDNRSVVLCISELLEHGLLGEGWLPTMRNLFQRKIVPSQALIIPSHATVYALAVQTIRKSVASESTTDLDGCAGWCHDYAGPHNYQPGQQSHPCSLQWPQEMSPSASVVLPVHAKTLVEQGRTKWLSESIPILTISARETTIPNTVNAKRACCRLTISETGSMDAILVWWKLHLLGDDNDEKVTYDSLDPGRCDDSCSSWQDHWQPCLHSLKESVSVTQGDVCQVEAWHDDNRIHVALGSVETPTNADEKKGSAQPPPSKRARSEPSSDKEMSVISPLRSRQLNNTERLDRLGMALDHILDPQNELQRSLKQPEDSGIVILDVSDFCLAGIFASQVCSKYERPCFVYSMESSSGSPIDSSGGCSLSLPVLSAQMAQANVCGGQSKVEFQVLQCHPESLSRDVVFPEKSSKDQMIDLVVAEPYYEMTETWPLLSAMNFYNIVRHLNEKNLISLDSRTCIVPSVASLCVCAISSPQIFSAYQSCGRFKDDEMVLGLDHSYVIRQRHPPGTKGGNVVLSLPMWQYQYTTLGLSQTVTTLRYNLVGQVEPTLQGSFNVSINTSGLCHGILIWVEYDLLQTSERQSSKISTLDESEHQLVVLLDNPINVHEKGTELVCTFQLDGCNSGLSAANNGESSSCPFQFDIANM